MQDLVIAIAYERFAIKTIMLQYLYKAFFSSSDLNKHVLRLIFRHKVTQPEVLFRISIK